MLPLARLNVRRALMDGLPCLYSVSDSLNVKHLFARCSSHGVVQILLQEVSFVDLSEFEGLSFADFLPEGDLASPPVCYPEITKRTGRSRSFREIEAKFLQRYRALLSYLLQQHWQVFDEATFLNHNHD